MIVARLLSVRVQPVFVFVDTDTADVTPAPPVQPADVPPSDIASIAVMIEDARTRVELHVGDQSPTSTP